MKPTEASVLDVRRALFAVLCLSLLSTFVATAQTTKAFPTAEGFGANSLGGRGGRVLEVTNLNDSGDGSLRSAMEASGPRICVFRVSGTITLKNAIRVRTPYLTVAGQTSPGGVQVKGSGQPEGDWGVWFVNGAHDIVVRHLRCAFYVWFWDCGKVVRPDAIWRYDAFMEPPSRLRFISTEGALLVSLYE